MLNCVTFQAQLASIMEVLAKRAVVDISKLVEDGSAILRLEIRRSRKENEALRRKILTMENELRTARCHKRGAEENSVNISLEVQLCDELRRPGKLPGEENSVPQQGFYDEEDGDQLLSTTIKHESADIDEDWCKPPHNGARLEEDLGGTSLQGGLKRTQDGQVDASLPDRSAWDGAPALQRPSPEDWEVQPAPEERPEIVATPCKVSGTEPALKIELENQYLTEDPDREGSILGVERRVGLNKESELVGVNLPRRKTRGENVDLLPSHEMVALQSFHSGRSLTLQSEEWGAGDSSCDVNTDSQMGVYQSSVELKLSLGPLENTDQSVECKGRLVTPQNETHRSDRCKQFSSKSHWNNKMVTALKAQQGCGKSVEQLCFTASEQSLTCSSSLEEHQHIDRGEKPFQCTQCGKGFRYKGYLKIHQRVHTREKPFTCSQCGKSFSQISNLKTHQITHTREKPFNCTQCGKMFSHLQTLKLHQSIHAEGKLFGCKICGRGFSSADSLSQHRGVHYGEKRFHCTLCERSFTARSSLKAHLSVHTGEKPFTCTQCGKSFSHLCNLKTHLRVHTGEKPFCCSLCGKSYSQNHVLQTHLRSHNQQH